MKFLKRLFNVPGPEAFLPEDLPEHVCGVTDTGTVRENNEDYFLICPDMNLYIAADGMGGHNAGDVASKTAAGFVYQYFTSEVMSQIKDDNDKAGDALINSLLDANKKIIEMAESKPEYRGMGCTIVVALINGSSLNICHVGDARAYVCSANGIELLTTDHSVVMTLVKEGKMSMEEARISPIKNEITQAIGAPGHIVPECNQFVLDDKAKVLLCSDGLWDMLSDEEIHETLKQKKSPKQICRELIKQANDAGGHDNITVIVVEHPEKAHPEEETLNADDADGNG